MRAICIEPEPKESEPLLESGIADAGEETLGEGAASVTVRCGNGGRWTVSGDAFATVGTEVMGGPATAFGFTLGCGWGAGTGARPGI